MWRAAHSLPLPVAHSCLCSGQWRTCSSRAGTLTGRVQGLTTCSQAIRQPSSAHGAMQQQLPPNLWRTQLTWHSREQSAGAGMGGDGEGEAQLGTRFCHNHESEPQMHACSPLVTLDSQAFSTCPPHSHAACLQRAQRRRRSASLPQPEHRQAVSRLTVLSCALSEPTRPQWPGPWPLSS